MATARPMRQMWRTPQDRLAAHGITVDEAQLTDLAGRYGVGGAVRLMAWAEETGMTVEEIAAMRDGDGTPESVMGWGQIAHELGVHPGIGSIMGNGGGGGRDAAPGQQDDTGDEGDASGRLTHRLAWRGE